MRCSICISVFSPSICQGISWQEPGMVWAEPVATSKLLAVKKKSVLKACRPCMHWGEHWTTIRKQAILAMQDGWLGREHSWKPEELKLFIPLHQPTNIIIEVRGGIPRLHVYMHDPLDLLGQGCFQESKMCSVMCMHELIKICAHTNEQACWIGWRR